MVCSPTFQETIKNGDQPRPNAVLFVIVFDFLKDSDSFHTFEHNSSVNYEHVNKRCVTLQPSEKRT